MKLNKQEVMLAATPVLDLSFAEKLNESTQNHYCPLFQQETTFLMGITAFAYRQSTWFLTDACSA